MAEERAVGKVQPVGRESGADGLLAVELAYMRELARRVGRRERVLVRPKRRTRRWFDETAVV